MLKAGLYDVALEIGQKKTFASAVAWPGWCRAGRDEEGALQALLLYSTRYIKVLQSTDLEFILPEKEADFNIIERVHGNAVTDFGTPNLPIQRDAQGISSSELQRFTLVLKASWQAFDQAVRSARGKQLRKGPRGGGRELEEVISHVVGAEVGYLRQLGWNIKDVGVTQTDFIHAQVIDGLNAAVRGQLPTVGPRGGKRWTPRYFVRRHTWHVLDHAWEIEDRIF